MTKIEALELELVARKMVEGTELDWWEVIKCDEGKFHNALSQLIRPVNSYELALGIIEGKPVWRGDIYYHKTNKCLARIAGEYAAECSWNPPKPKTVMVELPIEYAKACVAQSRVNVGTICPDVILEIAIACRKALEVMK